MKQKELQAHLAGLADHYEKIFKRSVRSELTVQFIGRSSAGDRTLEDMINVNLAPGSQDARLGLSRSQNIETPTKQAPQRSSAATSWIPAQNRPIQGSPQPQPQGQGQANTPQLPELPPPPTNLPPVVDPGNPQNDFYGYIDE